MKYFKNLSSLSELKSQYRKLALELHPDRGGDEEAFKEMGNEFSLLYEVWKNRKEESGEIREENKTSESANDFTGRFYEEQGWTGCNRDKYGYDNAKIVADVREYAKLRFPQFTFSITQDNRGCWTSSINVYLMQSPYKIYPNDEDGKIYAGKGLYRSDKYSEMTPEVRDAVFDVWDYLQTFNYDHSNAMYDIFDKGFYGNLEIGKRDKPYKVEVNRKFRTGGNAPEEFKWKDGPAHAAIKKAMGGNEWGYKELTCRDENGRTIYAADGYAKTAPDVKGGLFLGSYRYYGSSKKFDIKEYSQPSVQKRIMERLKAAGVLAVTNGYRIKFAGYTPETEAALAAEDKAKEEAYKAFLAKQGAPKEKAESKEIEKPQAVETLGSITIEDYSEKAIAVFGETKQYAELLKSLGGKFNRNLRGRAGWIFSKKRESAVREALVA